MNQFNHKSLTAYLVCLTFLIGVNAQSDHQAPQPLNNPMTVEYLQKNLRKTTPRLVLTKEIGKDLKAKVKTDPVIKNMYHAIQLGTKKILQEPLLERKQIGRRLLATSRELLYRINLLGIQYYIERDPQILTRIDQEISAVCQFSDWNPSHFLDVAEMSLAVALALDWTGKDLSKETKAIAIRALIDKGINPSYNKKGNTGWINGTNNWNQVCHGGMIAAAITIAEEDPELATKTIHRALEGMPHALKEYGPDGVYPEGSTYWGYGTSFTIITSEMLNSAFGTDFGLSDYPGLKESATFRALCNAPSGYYYNFADCGDKRSNNGDIFLAWFANKMQNTNFFEEERFTADPSTFSELSRLAGAGLVWLSQYKAQDAQDLPTAWKGEGANPIAIFTGQSADTKDYYLGMKGGRGMVPHGNMDGGSFIFELNGVRWVVDPGNQNYHALEKTGFSLWGRCQDCERWTLLTKNNYGHSTLTVNNELHRTEGQTTISEFNSSMPQVSFDMSAAFKGQLESAKRTFIKENDHSVIINDDITLSEETELVTWQLITQAAVELVDGGAILSQDGQKLHLENLSHPEIQLSVISLDPPPLKLDRRIDGLKRLEIRLPAYTLEQKSTIRVRLTE